MKLVNFLRRKFKKAQKKPKEQLHDEPLLVAHPPATDPEWQQVDSREGSLGIEPDINLPGHLHQRAPTPALEPEREGVFRHTWALVREYVGKLLKKEPRGPTNPAARAPRASPASSGSHYSN